MKLNQILSERDLQDLSEMDRRGFLKGIGKAAMGVGATAAGLGGLAGAGYVKQKYDDSERHKKKIADPWNNMSFQQINNDKWTNTEIWFINEFLRMVYGTQSGNLPGFDPKDGKLVGRLFKLLNDKFITLQYSDDPTEKNIGKYFVEWRDKAQTAAFHWTSEQLDKWNQDSDGKSISDQSEAKKEFVDMFHRGCQRLRTLLQSDDEIFSNSQ